MNSSRACSLNGCGLRNFRLPGATVPGRLAAALVLGFGLRLPSAPTADKPLWNTNIQTAIGLIDTESSIVRGDGALLEPAGDIGFELQTAKGPVRAAQRRQQLLDGRYPVVITRFESPRFSWESRIFTAPTAAGPCDFAVFRIVKMPRRARGVRLTARFYGESARLDSAGKLWIGARAVGWDPAGHADRIQKKWGYVPGPKIHAFYAWAKPKGEADPAFVNIRSGLAGRTLEYRFSVGRGAACPTALGLCEGYWRSPGKRIVVLEVEGAPPKTVDTIRDIGANRAKVFLFRGRDVNRDGVLTVRCRAAKESADQNCILNAIWILRRPFRAGDAARLRRRAGDLPLLYGVDCGGGSDQSITPMPRVTWSLSPDDGGKAHWLVVRHVPGRLRLRWNAAGTAAAESAAVRYWKGVYAQGVHLHIASKPVMDLWDMSIANVFMLRDRVDGFAVVKPGETQYDFFWYRDGAYLALAQDMAGYPKEAEASLELFWRRDLPKSLKAWGQQANGCWAAPPNEWDGQGQAMWALWRHYRLTGDRRWLAKVYPALRRGMEWIRSARAKTKTAAGSTGKRPLWYGLFPKGFGERIDRPLGYILYHDFWGVLGARCGWLAARELGSPDAAWMQKEAEDFQSCVARCCRAAAAKQPEPVIPGALGRPTALIWGGIAAVYPCEALPVHSPEVDRTFRRMEQRSAEGLYRFVSEEKIWPYYSTDWARAYLYRGEYDKALNIFRAYCAHAGPTRGWIEEIFLQSRYGTGDMPHGWAAADYIMLLRDMLVLERGETLHLFPCVDPAWLPLGERLEVSGCPTNFGPLACRLERPGPERLVYTLQGRWRRRPEQLVFHLPVGLPGRITAIRPKGSQIAGRTFSVRPGPGPGARVRFVVELGE